MLNNKISKENKKLLKVFAVMAILQASYWSFGLFRKTIIDGKILFFIILFSGTIAYIIESSGSLSKPIKRFSLLHLLKNIFVWGLLVCSLFMFSNYYLHSNEVKTSEHKLLPTRLVYREKGTLKSVVVEIEYNKKLKKLRVDKKYRKDIRKYKTISLDMTRGLFGFEIIKEHELNY